MYNAKDEKRFHPMAVALKRSTFLGFAGATLLGRPAGAQPTAGSRMNQRKIPSSGEMLPVIGCGTWRTFDVGGKPADRAPLAELLRVMFEAGGSVIDSSPMYGAAEGVVGDLLAAAGTRDKAFIATKVWTSGRDNGIAQMKKSMALLKTERLDLMQIHNLVDWRVHLPTLRAWKAEGRIRYLGVTHYTQSAHEELAAVLRAEKWDFVQVNYAIDDRSAERHLLPAAAEQGTAVIVNLPFGGRRDRLHELGAGSAEIRAGQSGRHLCHPRHQQA
jgi:diketogulonate reductase-like aldo/keto reductase